jgi:hypothetical protein
MLYTPHFLVGAAIMKYVPNPVIGLSLALVSHVVLDLIPHNDFDITPGMTLKDVIKHDPKKRNFLFGALAIDGGLLVLSAMWIYSQSWAIWTNLMNWEVMKLLLGGLVAISPDLVEQSLLLFGKNLPAIQDKFQNRVSAKYGFISYPIVSLIALWFLTK